MTQPAIRLARALAENSSLVDREVDGLGELEAQRALFFLLSAYDLATEMWFQKGGAALRLRGRPPRARFWSFVFYDRWFNTPDFPVHRCYLTGADIALDEDGGYEVLVGPDDTGHPNWIDTAGLREGIFAIRCLLPERRELPTAEVVTIGR